MNHLKFWAVYSLIYTTFAVKPCLASNYFGRFSLGSFSSTERFSSSDTDSDKNEHLNYSGRFYLRVTDIGPNQWEFVSDLRDKFDQFDSLNKTKLQLDPQNYYQTRQFFISNFETSSSINFMLGRFSLLESGGTYTDGMAAQYKINTDHRIGFFGGLNPLDQGQFVVTFNERAKNYGIYSHYEKNDLTFSKHLSLTHSYVSQPFDSEEDRRYFYQTVYYQWESMSRITSNLYIDFIPRTFIQNGTLNWDQTWSPMYFSHLNFLIVDTIQYRRDQGIREQLEPSPYQQIRLQLDYSPIKRVFFSPIYTEGKRSLDGLSKKEARIKFALGGYLDPKYDVNIYGGSRKNFITDDEFFGFMMGYYSPTWEVILDAESSTEVPSNTLLNSSQKSTLHPLIINLTASYVQNKNLFYSLAFESAKDENVEILAILFRLTHRFGSRYTPPLRDGAPTRGTL